jgi:hypothetical protein
MQRRVFILVFMVVVTLSSVGAAAAGVSASYAVMSDPQSSHGAVVSSSNYVITSTMGQPAIGVGASASYGLCSGFWCQAWLSQLQLFLPLVRR